MVCGKNYRNERETVCKKHTWFVIGIEYNRHYPRKSCYRGSNGLYNAERLSVVSIVRRCVLFTGKFINCERRKH